MAKKVQKKKKPVEKPAEAPRPKDFLDMVAPSAVKFFTDYAVIGGAYHTFMAVWGYPASTDEPALLRHLGEKSGVNIQTYVRQVTAAEDKTTASVLILGNSGQERASCSCSSCSSATFWSRELIETPNP